jgi:hypothetical protein
LAAELTAQGEDVDPGDLLALRHGQEEDIGWGQLRHAAALSADDDLDLSFGEAVDHLAGGAGWGQLRQAAALAADLGIAFDDALYRLTHGEGWGEIRDEFELDPGPPPWAGKFKIKLAKPGKPARHSGDD